MAFQICKISIVILNHISKINFTLHSALHCYYKRRCGHVCLSKASPPPPKVLFFPFFWRPHPSPPHLTKPIVPADPKHSLAHLVVRASLLCIVYNIFTVTPVLLAVVCTLYHSASHLVVCMVCNLCQSCCVNVHSTFSSRLSSYSLAFHF